MKRKRAKKEQPEEGGEGEGVAEEGEEEADVPPILAAGFPAETKFFCGDGTAAGKALHNEEESDEDDWIPDTAGAGPVHKTPAKAPQRSPLPSSPGGSRASSPAPTIPGSPSGVAGGAGGAPLPAGPPAALGPVVDMSPTSPPPDCPGPPGDAVPLPPASPTPPGDAAPRPPASPTPPGGPAPDEDPPAPPVEPPPWVAAVGRLVAERAPRSWLGGRQTSCGQRFRQQQGFRALRGWGPAGAGRRAPESPAWLWGPAGRRNRYLAWPHLVATSRRCPAESVGVSPAGTTLREYTPPGRAPFWEAYLLGGIPFEGMQNGKKRCTYPGLRSREQAWLECALFLFRAQRAGLLAPYGCLPADAVDPSAPGGEAAAEPAAPPAAEGAPEAGADAPEAGADTDSEGLLLFVPC